LGASLGITSLFIRIILLLERDKRYWKGYSLGQGIRLFIYFLVSLVSKEKRKEEFENWHIEKKWDRLGSE